LGSYQPDAGICPSHAHRTPHSPTPPKAPPRPHPTSVVASWVGEAWTSCCTTKSLDGVKWQGKSAPCFQDDWVKSQLPSLLVGRREWPRQARPTGTGVLFLVRRSINLSGAERPPPGPSPAWRPPPDGASFRLEVRGGPIPGFQRLQARSRSAVCAICSLASSGTIHLFFASASTSVRVRK
jgi:hypothetical protein